jgi:nicotinate-nucleotide adenylyltransferase
MKLRRIGLLGGTFNPIHNGHIHIANTVSKRLSLTEVLFIPTGHPPHKDPTQILSAKDRVRMLELALLPYPHFLLCDEEILREGISYTIDTIQALKKKYPDTRLFFIVGVDAFAQIKTWKNPDKILQLCDFAVISRPGFPFSKLPNFGPLAKLDRMRLDELDTGKATIYDFSLGVRTKCHFLNIPHSEISASDIRRRLSSGNPLKNLLPHPVHSYIIKGNLYKEVDHF